MFNLDWVCRRSLDNVRPAYPPLQIGNLCSALLVMRPFTASAGGAAGYQTETSCNRGLLSATQPIAARLETSKAQDTLP